MMTFLLKKIICLILLLVSLPLQILLWMLVKFSSRGPGLYRSVRLGQHKKAIRIWKFRTMDASIALDVMASVLENSEWRNSRKLKNDPRLTRIGKWLRRFSLDELPQLWNVLLGDMELIGPRPIVRAENRHYGRYSNLVHSIKPGMTGLWQVSGRNLTSYHRRIAINVYYVKHKSWKLDLWILYKTIGAVIYGRGAF